MTEYSTAYVIYLKKKMTRIMELINEGLSGDDDEKNVVEVILVDEGLKQNVWWRKVRGDQGQVDCRRRARARDNAREERVQEYKI